MLDFQAMISAIGPELLLALAGLCGVLAGAVMGDRFNGLSFKLGAGTLVLAALVVLLNWDGGEAFGGLVSTGPFVNFAKFVSFLAGAVTLLMGENFFKRHGTIRYEYPLLVIFASLGMGIILSASNLMTLYMGIETLSLSSYVLASLRYLAGLRLHRLNLLCRHRRRRERHWPSLRHGADDFRHGVQSFGCADARLDAGRL